MAKLSDLPKFLEGRFLNALDQAARASAQQVVQDLRAAGPWWTGDFARSWDVVTGTDSTTIEAADEGSRADSEPGEIPPKTARRVLPPVTVPAIGGRLFIRKGRYIIGNRNRYRDIAMDLAPGRWRGKIPPNTAPRDWYATYVNAGGLDNAIRLVSKPIIDEAWSRQ